jgi:GIY-YIG catalytic domain
MTTDNSLMGVYRIACITTGGAYIGGSLSVTKRLAQHRRDLNAARHHNAKLQELWNRFGSASFRFEILELVEKVDQIATAESVWTGNELRCLSETKDIHPQAWIGKARRMKTSIYFTDEDIAKLTAIKNALGLISLADAHRIALHAYRLPRKR